MRNKPTTWTLMILSVMSVLIASQSADARVRPRNLTDPGRDYTQGGVSLYASVGGQGYEIHDDDYAALDEFDETGFFSLGLGIGLDRRTSLFIEGIGSEHETPAGDYNLAHLMVGVKYAPNTGANYKWQPYGKASFGATFLIEDNNRHYATNHHDDDNGFMGPSLGLGVGIERFVSRRAALFGELGMTWTEFNTQIIDGEDYELIDDFGATSGRLQFGLRLRL